MLTSGATILNRAERADLGLGLLAALLAGIAPLLAWPVENAGFNDDWSYAHMAFSVAARGTYAYDGFATPMIGPQAYWGGLFARAIGPTHLALRCSTLALAAASAAIVYALARRCRLRPAAAFQAAAAFAVSPLVLPLAASFMTDVPGLFFGLLALLFADVARRARGDAAATGAFAAMLVAGVLGGMVRQTGWLILFVVAPLAMFAARGQRSRRTLAAWLAMTALAAAAVAAAIVRHARADFVATDDLRASLLAAAARPTAVLAAGIAMAVTLAAAASPALAAVARLAGGARLRATGAVAAIAVGLRFTTAGGRATFDPWIGNLLQPVGLLGASADLLGDRPPLLPPLVTVPLALASWGLLAGAAVGAATALAARRRTPAASRDGPVVSRDAPVTRRSALVASARRAARDPLAPTLAFGAACVALALLRSASNGVYDRYLIPVLPGVTIALLRVRQRRINVQPSRAAWALIALGGLLGAAFAFDYHAAMRARLDGLRRLEAAGVERRLISAGFELDGEAQLAAAGHINDIRMVRPAGAFIPVRWNPAWTGGRFWFWPYAPTLRPEYLIARGPVAGYEDAGLGTADYRTPFPPVGRSLRLLRLQPTLRGRSPLIVEGLRPSDVAGR